MSSLRCYSGDFVERLFISNPFGTRSQTDFLRHVPASFLGEPDVMPTMMQLEVASEEAKV
jgi:hypothetical protein